MCPGCCSKVKEKVGEHERVNDCEKEGGKKNYASCTAQVTFLKILLPPDDGHIILIAVHVML